MFNRNKIINKVLVKLGKESPSSKMTKDKTMDVIYDNFVDSFDAEKKNYTLKMKLKDDQQDLLLDLYNNGQVKRLYQRGVGRFGFQFDNLKFDVAPRDLEVTKL